MPLAEYMDWQRFDSTEPIGLSAALDRWFARLMFTMCQSQGCKGVHLEQFLTYTPHMKVVQNRILENLKSMGFKEKE